MRLSSTTLEVGKEYPTIDETALIHEIVTVSCAMLRRMYQPGEFRRDAHAKAHGCVKAEFVVESELPADLQYGVFKAGASYDALIRFSTAPPEVQSDEKPHVRGMAIKLLGVQGEKLLENEKSAQTQDFLLINSSFFFSPNIEDYREFTRDFEGAKRSAQWRYIPWHLRQMYLLVKMKYVPMDNPLTSRYWSAVPYKLGPATAVKYSAVPSNLSPNRRRDSPDCLRERMAAHLKTNDAWFDFAVQLQKNPYTMPVEDSSKEWDEEESPFIKVATIRIPKQTFNSEAQVEFAENLSFTPWHSLPEHQPLGGMNRVRKAVYEASSSLRHEMNDIQRREPTSLADFPEA
jgi:hypothetical protein